MHAFSWECVAKNNFLISQRKHMLWVLKRTISMEKQVQSVNSLDPAQAQLWMHFYLQRLLADNKIWARLVMWKYSLSSAFETKPSRNFRSSIFCWCTGDMLTGSLVGRGRSWDTRLGFEALERRSCILKDMFTSVVTGVGGWEEWT